MTCCICDEKIAAQKNGWEQGHNAHPLADGRCCTSCNALVVAARFAALSPEKREEVTATAYQIHNLAQEHIKDAPPEPIPSQEELDNEIKSLEKFRKDLTRLT